MGLFNKKNQGANKIPAGNKPQNVNPDDIWNSPVPGSKRKVTVKESKYGEATTEEITGVESIEPEAIKNKMAKLEAELEEKRNKPVKTYKDYDVNPVHNEEIKDAQKEYEKLYAVEHEKYIASHQEEITKAQEDGVDDKVKEMVEIHEEKVKYDTTNDFGFPKVDKDEVEQKVAELPYAKKPEDYPEYKDIKAAAAVSQSDIEKLGTIDHSDDDDNIKSVAEDLLEEKVKEFEEQYGDRKK